MSKYAVIGHPIGHSRSPGMHNAAFAARGIAAQYLKLDVAPEELGNFMLRAGKMLAGFNLTVPHKQAVIPYLDEIDPDALRIGSVNTVKVLSDGRFSGCSTDGAGFEEAVRIRLGMELAGREILLLGCGGAARAVAFRAAKRGARKIRIANRHAEKAAMLAEELGSCAEALPLDDTKKLSDALAESDLLVQATSLGLRPGDAPPLPLDLLDAAPGKLAVFDLVYLATPLLERAKARGLKFCDGKEMLLRQGAESFRFWTGVEPPVEAMERGMESEAWRRSPDEWRNW